MPFPRLLAGAIGLAGALLLAGSVAGKSGPGAEAGVDEPWMRLRPVVGKQEGHVIEPGETLHDVAWQHRLGFGAIERLNPQVDPWLPGVGTVVQLPTRYALPPAASEGLVVNLPEMRLYDFTGSRLRVYAVAVGDPDDPTPVGEYRVGRKLIDPVWHVPKSIRAKRPEMPLTLSPGEDNPLGSRWMTIGTTAYGIHGTNVRWSIGRGSTHGCVRMYEDRVQELFDRIETGTPIRLIYEPIKWGTNGKDLFLEVHPDIYGRVEDALARALELPRALGVLAGLDPDAVWEAVRRANGVPVPVGALP